MLNASTLTFVARLYAHFTFKSINYEVRILIIFSNIKIYTC
jgi:hypothetical protein